MLCTNLSAVGFHRHVRPPLGRAPGGVATLRGVYAMGRQRNVRIGGLNVASRRPASRTVGRGAREILRDRV